VTAARARLTAVARVLLDPAAEPGEAFTAAQTLFDLCCEQGGFDGSPGARSLEGLRLPAGVAIAPLAAARCVLDFARTRAFLRGVDAALATARARFGDLVEVLYAGCGPFAPLFLPLTTALPAGAARFTLLDAHAASIDCVRRLARAFDAERWLAAAEMGDACTWRAPRAPHVIVAEVMQAGLEREPQVAVTRALAPQLAPGGVFVPEEITLSVALADLSREFGLAPAPARVELGDVFRLRADVPPVPPSPVRVAVPADAGPSRPVLLLTRVRVHGEIELRECDSGVTYPRVLGALGQVGPGAVLEFRYRPGPDPGLDARVVG
jgi:hypothetical protein